MPLDVGLLALVHVLLLVYWLGGDLGVFYCAGFLIRPELPPATRRVVMQILHVLDQAPRICMALMLPVGTSLAVRTGYVQAPPWVVIGVWLLGAVWLGFVLIHATGAQTPLGRRIAPFDLALRVLVIAVLLAIVVWSASGAGPTASQGWLTAKLFVFALVVLNGLAIRVTFRPFRPAYFALLQHGSSAAIEATLARTVRRVRPVVLSLWGLLVVEAWLGLAKPF
jgi:hypothetical protein